jgi:hypothetical protein
MLLGCISDMWICSEPASHQVLCASQSASHQAFSATKKSAPKWVCCIVLVNVELKSESMF